MKYPLVCEAEILDHVKKYEMMKYEITNGNIAAIEFGTTSVALAYTTRGDKEVFTLVLNNVDIDIRVPSAILLRKDGALLTMSSFGQEARTNYTRMRPNDRKNHVYFERIKMLMKREEVHILILLVSSISQLLLLHRKLIDKLKLSHLQEKNSTLWK